MAVGKAGKNCHGTKKRVPGAHRLCKSAARGTLKCEGARRKETRAVRPSAVRRPGEKQQVSEKFYDPVILQRLQGELLSILDDFTSICEENRLEYFGIAGTGIGAIRHKGFIPWDDDIDIAMPRRDFDRFLKLAERQMGDKYLILNADREPNYPLMTTRLVKKGTIFIEEVMRDVDCPFGIFLDLYVLDNVADAPLFYQLQSWEAWFWSKLMILRCIPKPTLQQRGIKARLIWLICRAVYQGMKILHLSPRWLRARCEAACRRYDGRKTRRMAFLPDTSPYWNVVDKTKYHPLKKIEFEGRLLNFPANIEEMLSNMYGDYMKLPPVEKRKTHYPYKLAFSEKSGPAENFAAPAGAEGASALSN